MSETVTNENEIYLGGYRLPIKGPVRPGLISILPGKVTIGDYSLSDDQIASNWVISDQRGGPLIEEMDETVDVNRYWFGNIITRHKGHAHLPPLVTEATINALAVPAFANLGFETWSDDATPTGWTNAQAVRKSTTHDTGSYSLECNSASGVRSYQDASNWTNTWRNCLVTVTARVKTNQADYSTIRIEDGVNETDSAAHSGGNTFETLTVSRRLNAAATRLRIYCLVNSAASTNGHFFDSFTVVISTTTSGPVMFADFNSHLYLAAGDSLFKLNTGGTAFDFLYNFPANIKKLKRGVNNCLYITLASDTKAYWYMDTAETFAQTDSIAAQHQTTWSNVWWKMDSVGQIAYSATPNTASPAFTNNGKLTEIDADTIQGLLLGRDAYGDMIIYAVTQVGLWAHDTTNAVFLQTELTFPQGADNGKGFCKWRSAMWLAAGLSVKKYIPGSTASIAEVGLNQGDGLPAELNGKISCLIEGHDEMYALVDSSLVSGTSYSSLWSYNDAAWQCLWIASTANDSMHCGAVSSVYEYRLWFDHDSKIYYMPLLQGVTSPLKVSTYPYATGANHYTGWFDGSWIGDKTGIGIDIGCSKMSSDETITLYYRLDHCYNDLTSGWIQMGDPITVDGKKSFIFGLEHEGIACQAVQFKIAEVRGATTTKTPDMLYARFRYIKLMDTAWGYQVTVDANEKYGDMSPQDIIDAVKELCASKVLMEFTYRDDEDGDHSEMVRIAGSNGGESTGNNVKGLYALSLVAP